MKQTASEIEFLHELRSLLEIYDVDIVAEEHAIFELQFNSTSSAYHFTMISARGTGETDGENKQ